MESIKQKERTINDVVSELGNAQKHVEYLKHELADVKQRHDAYEAGYEAGRLMRALLDGIKDAGLSENQAFKLVMLIAEGTVLE